MPSQRESIEILLKVQADTEALRRTIELQREQARAQREVTDNARRQAAEQKAASEIAVAAELRRRETALEAVEFERERLRAGTGTGGGLAREGAIARDNALLERQRQIVGEIIALRLRAVEGGDELARANALREAQRLQQQLARETVRTAEEQRRAVLGEIEARRASQREVLRQYDERQKAAARANATEREGILSFRNLATTTAALTGVSLSIVGVASAVRSLITGGFNLAEQFKNTADRLGTTTEAVRVLDFAFRRGGQSIAEVERLAFSLNRRLDEARGGNENAAKSFFALGLSLEQLANLSTEQRLVAIGRALIENEGNVGALEAATEILGQKSQRTFENLQNLGRVGFEEFTNIADRLGQLPDEGLDQRLEQAKQRWSDFWRSLTVTTSGGIAAMNGLFTSLGDVIDIAFGSQDEALRSRINQLERRLAGLREALPRVQADGSETAQRFAAIYQARIDELQAEVDGLRGLQESQQQDARAGGGSGPASLVAAYRQVREAARERQIAEERANLWLRENAEKVREQNEALRRALLSDEARLAVLQEQRAAVKERAARDLAAAQSAAEQEQVRLQSENERLRITQDIARLEETIAAAKQRQAEEQRRAIDALRREAAQQEREDAAAARRALDAQIQARETQIGAIEFERDQLNQRTDLPETQKQERLNALLERQIELLAEVYNLRATLLPAATEEERAGLEAQLQALDQRVATLLGGANAPGSGDFLKQIELAETLKSGIEGVADALANALVAGESLREGLSNAFRQIAGEIAAAALRALVFRSIMSAAPAFGEFLGLPALGFARGGYTGAGAKHEVAGVVHRGEYVVPKDAVDRTGPAAWASMVAHVRGYEEGGLVAPAPSALETMRFSDPSVRTFSSHVAGESRRAPGERDRPLQVVMHFASGLQKSELAALLPELENRAVAAVNDAARRNQFSG